MLAVIMAGGQGERLRPLTCTIPKPLALVGGQPILAHCLNHLKKHGVHRAAVTLGYLPGLIEDEFDAGEDYGVELTYFTESSPLGTAGGVKLCRDFLSETFVVLSGDGITNADLSAAYAFHRKNHALATLIVRRVSNPTEYGLVNADESGRIHSFLEKPDWKDVDCDLANTGIYILEPDVLSRIPDGERYDFARDLFPSLLKSGLPVYAFETEGYWCDVGNTEAYLNANRDVLLERIAGFPSGGSIRMPGAVVDERAYIENGVFIGSGAHIMKNAFIGEGSVIADGCVVMEGASVKRSILYPGSIVRKNAQLRCCVVCPRAQIGENAGIFEQCVVGEKTVIGANTILGPGVKIWPGKHIGAGKKVQENIIWGERTKEDFRGSALNVQTPSEALSAAAACAWKMNLRSALIAREPGAVCANQARAFACGLIGEGVHVYEIQEGTLPLLKCAIRHAGLDAGFFITGDSVTPVERTSLPVSPALKRLVSAALSRQDAPAAYHGDTYRTENAGRFDLVYLTHLETALKSPLRRFRAAVYAVTEVLLYLAENAFKRAHYDVRAEWEEELMELEDDEIGVYLSEDGGSVVFSSPGHVLTEAENEMLIGWCLLKSGEDALYAPPGATRALDQIAQKEDKPVQYFSDEYDFLSSLLSLSPFQHAVRTDGLFCALFVFSILSDLNLSLEEALSAFPVVNQARSELPLPDECRASALSRFRKAIEGSYSMEHWFIAGRGGCTWVTPSEDKPAISIVSEARDMETAQEITDFFSRLMTDSISGAEQK